MEVGIEELTLLQKRKLVWPKIVEGFARFDSLSI
jgi:hypothetical protein